MITNKESILKRNTLQRKLVLNAVNALKCHANAEQIYNYVVKIRPSVSKGTVYRNLNSLVEDNLIRRVEIPGEADRFDHNCYKHHHIKCIECNNLFDVTIQENLQIDKLIKDNLGIELLDYEIIFKGICPECKNKKGE